jgi:hypothetical protein
LITVYITLLLILNIGKFGCVFVSPLYNKQTY